MNQLKRVEYLINNKPNIIKKFFSNYEWEYAEKKSNKSQALTGIWCAKEAVVKAFSNINPILITDVKLKHNVGGKPYVYSIENKKIISTLKIDISISHTKDYATAVAIIFTI